MWVLDTLFVHVAHHLRSLTFVVRLFLGSALHVPMTQAEETRWDTWQIQGEKRGRRWRARRQIRRALPDAEPQRVEALTALWSRLTRDGQPG